MTSKEKQLAGKLLGLASDEFVNHGCNDLDESWLEDWTNNDKRALINDMVNYNIIDKSDVEGEEGNYDWLIRNDSILMTYFATKLMKG